MHPYQLVQNVSSEAEIHDDDQHMIDWICLASNLAWKLLCSQSHLTKSYPVQL